jgi:ribonuclease Z
LNKAVVNTGLLSIEALRALKSGVTVQDITGGTVRPEDALLPPDVPRSFVYDSDTLPCAGVVASSRGAGLLFHDSTFADGMRKRAKETGHSTAMQAAEIAKEAGVGTLMLGHISARYAHRSDELHEEARSVFSECIVARDGLVVEVPRGHSVEKFSHE